MGNIKDVLPILTARCPMCLSDDTEPLYGECVGYGFYCPDCDQDFIIPFNEEEEKEKINLEFLGWEDEI